MPPKPAKKKPKAKPEKAEGGPKRPPRGHTKKSEKPEEKEVTVKDEDEDEEGDDDVGVKLK